MQRIVTTKTSHPSKKSPSVVTYLNFLRRRRDWRRRTLSVSAADRQAQLSYLSNRYASQPSLRRVTSLDKHYSKQAKASDETGREPRRTHHLISGRRSGRRATQNKHARPLRVLDATQSTLFGYGPRHARQAEHEPRRLGVREKSLLRINRLYIMGI